MFLLRDARVVVVVGEGSDGSRSTADPKAATPFPETRGEGAKIILITTPAARQNSEISTTSQIAAALPL